MRPAACASRTAGSAVKWAGLTSTRDTGRCGYQLAQDFQVLGDKFAREKIVPCDVAARPREAGNQTEPDRIFSDIEDDGDGRGGRLGRQRRLDPPDRDDHRDRPAGQFARQHWQPVELVLGPTVLDRDVLAFGITALLQPWLKPAQASAVTSGDCGCDEADHRHRRLLRARRERPSSCRAAKQRDEFAPLHSITSSASESRLSEILTPSAFAVVRLMTNSNFVGLHHRQVGGLRALQDLAGVDADLTPRVQKIGPIAHQPTGFDELAKGIGRGNPMMRCERRKLDAPAAEEPAGGDEEGVGTIAYEGGEGRLDLAGARARFEDLNLQSEGACSFRHVSQRGLGGRNIGRIDQHGNPNRLGHQVAQEPQPLGHSFRVEKIDAGRHCRPAGQGWRPDPTVTGSAPTPNTTGIVVVAALAASAPAPTGVAIAATRRRTKSAMRGGRRSYWPASPVILDCHVLALDGAGFVEAFTERSGMAHGGLGRPAADKADHRQCRLLRARRERPRRRRATEQRDELAPSHSITSSARASSVGGTSRPSALAVLRLITSSNLVGCMTGRSAGLAPLRMRPT